MSCGASRPARCFGGGEWGILAQVDCLGSHVGTRACPKCSRLVDEADEFCRECGGDLRSAIPPGGDRDDTEIGPTLGPAPPRRRDESGPARVLFGRFEVVRTLGRGGMGTVYEARDRHLEGAAVALKVLHPELARNPEARTRLKREVLVARELGNPDHVVRVYGYHEESGEDGLAGFDMELLEGASLAANLSAAGLASPFSDLT